MQPNHLSDCFDLTTFCGRLQYSWAVFSPLNLCWGESAVAGANAALADSSSSYEQRQHALTVRAACAPNGELLPWPVRACGWALGGTPIIAFMVSNAVHHPDSLLRIFLGQFLNQSHLAGATYCNRGGSAGGADAAAIAKAYVVSIATAVPIAFAAAASAKRWEALRPLARFAPFPGVASANALACVTMRQADVADGIPVRTSATAVAVPAASYAASAAASTAASNAAAGCAVEEAAVEVGTSRAAGWAAVRDTALTRLCMPVGNFVLVPSILFALQRQFQRPSGALGIPAQAAVTAAVFSCWLPLSASLFPPTGSLPVDELEPELRNRLDGRVACVTYSRGV